MNNNFGKNVMGGLLIAFYLMCFAFPVGLVWNMFNDHLPIGQFLVNEVLIFFVVWFIGYFCTELYRDMIARANKPRSEDEKTDQDRNRNEQNLNSDKKIEKDPNGPEGEDRSEK